MTNWCKIKTKTDIKIKETIKKYKEKNNEINYNYLIELKLK